MVCSSTLMICILIQDLQLKLINTLYYYTLIEIQNFLIDTLFKNRSLYYDIVTVNISSISMSVTYSSTFAMSTKSNMSKVFGLNTLQNYLKKHHSK